MLLSETAVDAGFQIDAVERTARKFQLGVRLGLSEIDLTQTHFT
jgi:hypothetical protein